MTEQDRHDDELVTEAYRALERPEPPERVDRAILDLAAHATAEKRRPAWPRWMTAASVAATVLLSFALVMQIMITAPVEVPGVIDDIVVTARDAGESSVSDPLRPSAKVRAEAARKSYQASPELDETLPAAPPPAPGRAAPLPQSPGSDTEAAANGSRAFDEITVSTRRREESPGDMPMSIAADEMAAQAALPGTNREDRDAETRIAAIRALVDKGRDAEAAESLDDFIVAYPDYDLPADLAELAAEWDIQPAGAKPD